MTHNCSSRCASQKINRLLTEVLPKVIRKVTLAHRHSQANVANAPFAAVLAGYLIFGIQVLSIRRLPAAVSRTEDFAYD